MTSMVHHALSFDRHLVVSPSYQSAIVAHVINVYIGLANYFVVVDNFI